MRRSLSVFLFAFAAGLGILAARASMRALMSGDFQHAVIMATMTPLVLTCGVVGRFVWSGQAMPRWFLAPTMISVVLTPLVDAVVKGRVLDALALIVMLMSCAITCLLKRDGKPSARPSVLDDLA